MLELNIFFSYIFFCKLECFFLVLNFIGLHSNHKRLIFVSMDSSLKGSIKVVSFFELVIKSRLTSIKGPFVYAAAAAF